MMRAYYICIWPVHAGLPKSQVSSLKSQVSTPSGLPKSQVSSLKYLSVFFIFFSFHDKSNCVCCKTSKARRIASNSAIDPSPRTKNRSENPVESLQIPEIGLKTPHFKLQVRSFQTQFRNRWRGGERTKFDGLHSNR